MVTYRQCSDNCVKANEFKYSEYLKQIGISPHYGAKGFVKQPLHPDIARACKGCKYGRKALTRVKDLDRHKQQYKISPKDYKTGRAAFRAHPGHMYFELSDTEIKEKLHRYSLTSGRSKSDIVKDALHQFLRERA